MKKTKFIVLLSTFGLLISACAHNSVTVNKNTVPFDPQGPTKTSGLRLGTPAVTTRGFNEDDMKIVGKLVANTIFDFEGTKAENVTRKISPLNMRIRLFYISLSPCS